jgi:hypothetical protein
MSLYKISEWEPGLKVVSLVQLIREIKSQDLLKSKREVEGLLEGIPIIFEIDDISAVSFFEKLIAIGVHAKK